MPPIVYFEDPTYTQVKTVKGREMVRRWKYVLERKGLYNASLFHICSDECFEPLHQFDKETDPELLNVGNVWKARNMAPKTQWTLSDDYGSVKLGLTSVKMDDEHDDRENDTTKDDTMHNYVEPIYVEEGIYGCPRHGTVHVCDSNLEVRKAHCTVRYADRFGEERCRFSSRTISEAPPLFNPYTEITMSVMSNKEYEEWEEQLAKDNNIYGSGAKDTSKRQEPIVALRNAAEKKQDLGLAKSLAQMAARSIAPSPPKHVIPSIQRAAEGALPTKRLTQSDIIPAPWLNTGVTTGLGDHQKHSLTATKSMPMAFDSKTGSSKRSQAASGRSNIPKLNVVKLPYQLQISRDAMMKIRKVVTDLLADPVSRKYTGMKTSALDPKNNPEHAAFVTLCCVRAAILLALINAEGSGERFSNNHKRTGCLTVNTRNLAITALYLYARGYNVDGGQNFIPADARLRNLLPSPNQLRWFGLKEDLLKTIGNSAFRAHTGAASLIKKFQTYEENMATSEMVKIQQVISSNMQDTAYGRETMARMLNINQNMLEDFDEFGIEDVTYEGDGTARDTRKSHRKALSQGYDLQLSSYAMENNDYYSGDEDY